MERLKQTLIKLPEFYLLAVALLYGFSIPFNINFVATGLLIILIIQIIFKNKIMGLIIGSIFLVISIGFLAALTSEFSEFKTINAKAIQLLVFGLLFIGINLAMSGLMIYKYAFLETQKAFFTKITKA